MPLVFNRLFPLMSFFGAKCAFLWEIAFSNIFFAHAFTVPRHFSRGSVGYPLFPLYLSTLICCVFCCRKKMLPGRIRWTNNCCCVVFNLREKHVGIWINKKMKYDGNEFSDADYGVYQWIERPESWLIVIVLLTSFQ